MIKKVVVLRPRRMSRGALAGLGTQVGRAAGRAIELGLPRIARMLSDASAAIAEETMREVRPAKRKRRARLPKG